MRRQIVPLQESIKRISDESGLKEATVRDLLIAGWSHHKEEGFSKWVSPEAQMPIHIPHDEPECSRCVLYFPHKHGLTCSKTCPECHGICHPDCPAYKE